MSQARATGILARVSPGLDRFHLVAEIGRGGMADVFLAVRRDDADERLVIKQLRSDVTEDEDFQAMFLDEARLSLQLVHPNVVRTYEVGRDGDRCFIVMEFLDGQPLSRLRRRGWQNNSMPLDVQLRILSDALAGLHYVHERTDADGSPLGIVHRDVSPPNVFISYDGRVKVVDFGIAKAAMRRVETRVGVVKGKISYMAPEHARGEKVDRRSDIFSVGVMLWEAASGKRFWHGHDDLAIYRQLLAGDLPQAVRHQPGAHSVLQPVLDKALAVDPDRRYATAAEMRDAVEHALRRTGSVSCQSAVGRCIGSLFARERIEFHTALRAELSQLSARRSGRPPSLLSRSQPALQTESHLSRTAPPTVAVVQKGTRDTIADFRPARAATRVGTWLAASMIAAFAIWFFRQRAAAQSDAHDRAPYAAAPGPAVALPHESPPADFRSPSAVAAGDVGASVPPPHPAGPSPAPPPRPPRAWTPVARPAPAPAGPVAPVLGAEFKHQPRAKRALDQGDPWVE